MPGGGHTTKSPDGTWTVSVWDREISSGVQGVTMELYRGEQPVNPGAKDPVLTFEAPLKNFDARSSGTKAQWTEDGRECQWTLAADRGEALLLVCPGESRVLFESRVTPEIVYHMDIFSGGMIAVMLAMCIMLYRVKRA